MAVDMEIEVDESPDWINNLIKSTFTRPELMGFVEWADTHFYLSAEATNTAGIPWTTHGYQKAPMHTIADLAIPETVIPKPTQIGMSQILKAFIGYEVAHRFRSVGIWVPRDNDLIDFAGVQLKSMLEDVPVVAEQLKAEVGKKDTDNTNRRKAFLKAQLYARASQSPANYTAISIESALMDEANRMPRRVAMTKEEEGVSPMDVVKGRMDAAVYANLVITSTLTEVGKSNTGDRFSKCRQKFYQYHECPGCNIGQEWVWGSDKLEYGFKWNTVLDKTGVRDNYLTALTGYYQCKHCDYQIQYSEMRDIDNRHSRYQSEDYWICNETGNWYALDDDEGLTPMPKEPSVGIQIRGFISRTKSWQEGIFDYLEAMTEFKLGDSSKLIRWTQEYLGDDWAAHESSESKKLSYKILENRQEDYGCDCPPGVQYITEWWDIQQDRIEGWTMGWGYGEECWPLEYLVRMGDPGVSTVTDVITHRADHKTFEKPDGNVLKISLTGIDCGYRPEIAYDLSIDFDRTRILPTRGEGEVEKPIVFLPAKPDHKTKTYRVHIGTESAKDLIYGRYKLEMPGPGYIHVPIGRGVTIETIKGMCIEVKKLRKGVLRWGCDNGGNEPLDCIVGNLSLIRVLQQRYGVVLQLLGPEAYEMVTEADLKHKVEDPDAFVEAVADGAEKLMKTLERVEHGADVRIHGGGRVPSGGTSAERAAQRARAWRNM